MGIDANQIKELHFAMLNLLCRGIYSISWHDSSHISYKNKSRSWYGGAKQITNQSLVYCFEISQIYI